MGIDMKQIVEVNNVELFNLENEKNRLWGGAVLFGFLSGLSYALVEITEKGFWHFPAAITGTASAIMVPCAIVRTTTYHRARWEVRHDILIKKLPNKQTRPNQQATVTPIAAPQKTPEEIKKQEEWEAQQKELREIFRAQQQQQ